MKDKNDKEVALVTGGSRGIGRAILESLLEEGWVVRFCSRSKDSVEGAKQELAEKYPGKVDGLPGSVRTEFSHPSGRPSDNWRLAPEDVARVVVNLLAYPDRALPSLVEIRPSQPPKK